MYFLTWKWREYSFADMSLVLRHIPFKLFSIFAKSSILDIWQVLNAQLYITNGISSIMNNIWKDFDANIKTKFK